MGDLIKSILNPLQLREAMKKENIEHDQRMCLVFMPFRPEFDDILNECIKPAAEKSNLWVYRVDNSKTSGYIINDILRALYIAGQVIVDLTDNNPNVLYELGLSHCYKRIHEVIIIKNGKIDLPFDVSPIRAIEYSASIEGKEQLFVRLEQCFNDIIDIRCESFLSDKRRCC